MKLANVLILLFLITLSSCEPEQENLIVIPKPESMVMLGGNLKLSKNFTISIQDNKLSSVVEIFGQQVKQQVTPSVETGNAAVEISLIQNKDLGNEGYQVNVTRKKIFIKAQEAHGIFNALQTLRQMILFGEQKNGEILLPCCQIKDTPRFSWRGIMVDESRHFFGKEKIEQLMDIMSLHKLNSFHWHLTDEPGWRIEIKKYPNLTLIGGKGNYHDPDAPAAFYTQEDIKEIARYAAARFITIIPEVDMPGHAAAANKAYPEFSGGGSPNYPDFTFNPGKDGTYQYLTNILKEISEIIPSPYLHTGGDEVYFGNEQWNTNPDVQKLMKKENLKDLKEVETYFNRRMADSVKSLQKTLAGWDEVVEAGLDPSTSIVMWWRHDKTNQLTRALEKNYKVVLCPRIPLYFDFVQNKSHQWGRKSKGEGCTEENVYNFPPDTLPGLKQYPKQIIGIQANLWSEVIQNNDRFDFMLYPRVSALAEAGWTAASKKNYKDFAPRLQKMLNYYEDLKLHYYDPFNPEKNSEPAGVKKPQVKIASK